VVVFPLQWLGGMYSKHMDMTKPATNSELYDY
jgi:hypothetical protein